MLFKGLDNTGAAVWAARNNQIKSARATESAGFTEPTGDAEADAKYWWRIIGLGDDVGEENKVWNDRRSFRVLEWGGVEV